MEDIIDTKEMSHQLVKSHHGYSGAGKKRSEKKVKRVPFVFFFFWSFSVFTIHLLLPLSKQ